MERHLPDRTLRCPFRNHERFASVARNHRAWDVRSGRSFVGRDRVDVRDLRSGTKVQPLVARAKRDKVLEIHVRGTDEAARAD
jgi:hypothetical protein